VSSEFVHEEKLEDEEPPLESLCAFGGKLPTKGVGNSPAMKWRYFAEERKP